MTLRELIEQANAERARVAARQAGADVAFAERQAVERAEQIAAAETALDSEPSGVWGAGFTVDNLGSGINARPG